MTINTDDLHHQNQEYDLDKYEKALEIVRIWTNRNNRDET